MQHSGTFMFLSKSKFLDNITLQTLKYTKVLLKYPEQNKNAVNNSTDPILPLHRKLLEFLVFFLLYCTIFHYTLTDRKKG